MCVSCFYGDGNDTFKKQNQLFFFQIDEWSGYQEWNYHWQPKSNNSIIHILFDWLVALDCNTKHLVHFVVDHLKNVCFSVALKILQILIKPKTNKQTEIHLFYTYLY